VAYATLDDILYIGLHRFHYIGSYVIILKSFTGYFWHVTDFHWDYSYGRQNISCEKDVKSRGVFGNYRCDAPWTLVVSSVNGMKLLKPEVDFVLWTG
jgi:sphingomyelin phosphodiesterase acid-like 3